MTLPPEILGHSFRYLEKSTLFNVRLVCKAFEQSASPLLFDQVYISGFRTDLEVVNLTLLRFGRYVRTMVFAINYLNIPLDKFRTSLQQNFNSDDVEPPENFHLHLRDACDRYSKRRAEWREVNKNGELISRLCFFLGKMPRLEAIKIATFPLFEYHSRDSLASPDEPARILYNEALDFMSGSIWAGSHTANSIADRLSAWCSLIHALSITKTRVKQLVLHEPCGCLPMACFAFDASQTQFHDLGESFRCLTTLRLTFFGVGDDVPEGAAFQHNLANALTAASNLEHLQLNTCYIGTSHSFGIIFEVCRFPRLSSVDLAHTYISDEQLMTLFGSSPGLQNLALYQIRLTQGTWERVTSWIKHNSQLRNVCLEKLLGGEPHPFKGDEAALVDPNDVKNFILHNGENPYTKESLERIMADQALFEDVSIRPFKPIFDCVLLTAYLDTLIDGRSIPLCSLPSQKWPGRSHRDGNGKIGVSRCSKLGRGSLA